MGRSTFRQLRVLREAGVEYRDRYRNHLRYFLDRGFESAEGREEWLRQAIFAVKLRGVGNAGAYIKKLADGHVHSVLDAEELERYRRARSRGFGSNGCWDPR